MKSLQKCWGILILLGILMLNTNIYAADALYRFMHNDHDALIIGEITGIDENGVKVRVEKNIVSAKNLNEAFPKKQLKLTEVKVALPIYYAGFYNTEGTCKDTPSVGDYVLMSLKRSRAGFEIAWGAYKVDSLDYKNLSIVLPENVPVWLKMDAAAVKTFINSDGQITEFAFDGDNKTVYAGEERTVIFNGNDEGIMDITPNNTIKTPGKQNQTQVKSPIAVIGGADGPTTIFVSGNPLKPLIVLVAIFTVIVFAIGFAIGYMVKARRSG